MGRRRRRSPRKSTRRRFLAGGLLAIGGASLLGGTQSFTQFRANRASSVSTVADKDALIGLDLVSVAGVGENVDNVLGEVTNNTDIEMGLSANLATRSAGEEVETLQQNLSRDESTQITSSLDEDRAVGGNPVVVQINGESSNINIDLSRQIPVPSFSWQVLSTVAQGGLWLDIYFEVDNITDYSLDIEVRNTTSGNTENFNGIQEDGHVTYPKGENPDYRGNGEDFEISFILSSREERIVLNKTEVVTGGENDGEGDFGDEDGPSLNGFTIFDYNNMGPGGPADYEISFDISNKNEFGSAIVKYAGVESPEGWSGEAQATQPDENVTFREDGGGWQSYDITINLFDSQDKLVKSVSITHTPGEGDRQWPDDFN